jgi:hypothetical protein
MRSSQVRDRNVLRVFERAMHLRILILCVAPFLAGCIPGFGWGGEDSEHSSFSSETQNTPALNRTYKSSFLSLQMPSFGGSHIQGQLMPDSGPAILTAFATVESRRPAQPNTPGGFGARQDGAQGFEPAVLPAAQALENFYNALAGLASGRRSRPVSVVHFGDDHIVDDRFAGSVREHLIGRFGGAGRGLMMPGLFPVRGMKVDRGGQWALATAAADQRGPFGITGVRMTSAASDAWLRFTSAQAPFDWLEVTFLTGPRLGTAVVSVDGVAKYIPTNTPTANQTSIRIGVRSSEILIRPRGDGEVSVLSVATGTNTPGLVYANLGLPGAAAWTSLKWDAGFAASDLRKLNPDLIVLGFGTREGFEDDLDVRQYEARLRVVIDQIKEWSPQSSILVIGPPDAARLPGFAGSAGEQVCRSLNTQELSAYGRMMERGDERLARWHAPPRLDAVRLALRRAAATSGAFYWDWAKYMGGPCSIHAWTSSVPPLAAPDHMTLTEAGNDRSARALFAEIMAGYDSYQRALQAKAQAIVASAETKTSQPAKASRKKRP